MSKLPIDPAARTFLDRLDAIDEVSGKHPIFLTADPEDEPWDGAEPPVRRCCFTTIPTPVITNDSHKARIRKLAQRNQELVSTLPKRLSLITFLVPFIPAIFRLIVQIVRPVLWLYFLYKTIIWGIILGFTQNSHFELINEIPFWFTAHVGMFTLLSYTVYHDEMILREIGWTSEVKAGIYFNQSDPLMSKITANNRYFNGSLQYHDISCPWMPTGDTRTAIPFALYSPPEIDYIRRWVSNPDGEAVAFDISFPIRKNQETGQDELYHDSNKICHLVLFGLNGGSNEPYILDFANRMNARGHTVVCLITRGFMGTPIVNARFFDGSRSGQDSDLHQVIKSLHAALGNSIQPDLLPQGFIPGSIEEAERVSQTRQPSKYTLSTVFTQNVFNRKESIDNGYWTTPIMVTGWSMGGVITSSYAVSMGDNTGLLACACLAASADAVRNINYEYSKRTWQSFLTIATLINIIVPQQHLLAEGGGGKSPISIDALAKTKSIIDFDKNFSVPYHGWNSVEEYYQRLSFARHPNFHNLDVPTLIMHCDDDPVITVDVNLPCIEALQKGNLKNTLVMICRGGGHLGFATTLKPFTARWKYPISCIHNFAQELLTATQFPQKTCD